MDKPESEPEQQVGGFKEKHVHVHVPINRADRGYWTSLKKEVDKACEHFWSQDQICGFTADGERIGTGIPRRMKQFQGNHEYSL